MENDGKIHNNGSNTLSFTDELSFFGPGLKLKIHFPTAVRDKLLFTFYPPVLCTALVDSKKKPAAEDAAPLSFRAASLANLNIRPLNETKLSFEWKISPPVWLPAYKRVWL